MNSTKTYKLEHPLFQAAIPVIEKIEKAGFEAYFVGGCVRDTILNRPIHDVDIASSATPEEIQDIFPKTFDVGKKHGTIIVLEQGEAFELTTFRTEGTYSDFRRPDSVTFVRDLEEDTLRRDFTVNALAFDKTGKLYDYHGGIDDLKAKKLRAVGVAKERFQEDALRMLRALRFASQLGFTVEEETMSAIIELAPNLLNISVERIRIELSKYFQGDYYPQYYDLLSTSKLGNYMPGFSKLDIKFMSKYLKEAVELMIEKGIDRDEELVWALFLSASTLDLASCSSLLRKWTHSNNFVSCCVQIIELLKLTKDTQLTPWQIYKYSIEALEMFDKYRLSHNNLEISYAGIYNNLPIKSKDQLQINGSDVIKVLNLEKGGPIIGEIIAVVEEKVVKKELENDRYKLLEFVKDYSRSQSRE